MINPRRLVAIARKWQKLAATGRRRISLSRAEGQTSKKSAPSKGHFIIYTTDGKRFAVPLAYLNSPIFQELFEMSEDEYGLPRDGPITMPCDAVFMNYIISLLQRAVPKEVEGGMLVSIAAGRCSVTCLHSGQRDQPMFVCGY